MKCSVQTPVRMLNFYDPATEVVKLLISCIKDSINSEVSRRKTFFVWHDIIWYNDMFDIV